MEFDVSSVPFSRRGSWLSFSWIGPPFLDRLARPESGAAREGLYFRTVRDRGQDQQLFRVENLGGLALSDIRATPSLLKLSGPETLVEICMPEPRIVRFRGRGAGLRLETTPGPELSFAIPRGDGWMVNSLGAGFRMLLRPLVGAIRADAPWRTQGSVAMAFDLLPDESGFFDLVVEEYLQEPKGASSRASFEEEEAAVSADFRAFASRHAGGRGADPGAAELAAYVQWSCLVEPEESVTRPAMLMSKNWMTGVWSWDHCFNAIALCRGDPSLAWDQMMVLFDHQDEFGALPDAVFNRRVVWNFTKPPVHGWAVSRMLREGALDGAMREEAYDRLTRWTEFWLSCRDYDGDGVPQYDHGNDSGWDNASVFSARPPVEAPDLAAFLVLQMDALALLAESLGRPAPARAWRERSSRFLDLALRHLTRGGMMAHIASGTHEAIASLSLLPYMQLLLGERLPEASRRLMLRSLKEGGFLTEWGLATESTRSPLYESDGYWLGPIWAPSTLLMVDALEASGEAGLASEVARRYLALAERSGFPENYDAQTGEALRDRAYTWTASVYLILGRERL
jgi:putative isomerase